MHFSMHRSSSFTCGYEVFLNMFVSVLKLGWPVSYDKKPLCFVVFFKARIPQVLVEGIHRTSRKC